MTLKSVSGTYCNIFSLFLFFKFNFQDFLIALTSQALASLYVVRQYIASSMGKKPLEWLTTNYMGSRISPCYLRNKAVFFHEIAFWAPLQGRFFCWVIQTLYWVINSNLMSRVCDFLEVFHGLGNLYLRCPCSRK